VSEVVQPGHWFLSIYNGGNKRADLQFSAIQTSAPLPCPNNCNGRGICFNGTCICLPKWKGTDCDEGALRLRPINSDNILSCLLYSFKQIVCQLAAMAMESVAMASASVIRGGKEWTALSVFILGN
jgi:hypothetical protein